MIAQIHFLACYIEEAIQVGRPYVVACPELAGWVAAAFGILGRASEAKVEGRQFLKLLEACWAGVKPMRPQDATTWLLSVNRFLRGDDLALLLRGLRAAGLPPPDSQVDQ